MIQVEFCSEWIPLSRDFLQLFYGWMALIAGGGIFCVEIFLIDVGQGQIGFIQCATSIVVDLFQIISDMCEVIYERISSIRLPFAGNAQYFGVEVNIVALHVL